MREKRAIKTVVASIGVNIGMALVKLLAGYLGNSFALIADGIESTADTLSSVLLLIGLRYAHRPADSDHPYGHGRAEPLLSFMIAAFLVVSAGFIIYNGIGNLSTPHELPRPYTLAVLLVIIGGKEIFFRIVMSRSKQVDSGALKAEAWHHRSDAITSLLAFIGISVALIMGPGYEQADDWAAIAASAIILYNAYTIFRPALGELMDEHVYEEMVEKVREVARTVEGVRDTEKCHIRKNGMRYLVDLHLIVDADISVREGHDIAHRLKAALMLEMPQVANVLIHVEPG